jgi:hypothetical protein
LRDAIDDDRYPLSPRVKKLKAILAKFGPVALTERASPAEALNREFFWALWGIESDDQGRFRPDQGIPLWCAFFAFEDPLSFHWGFVADPGQDHYPPCSSR